MRPIKLTMQAFGSYGKETTVDFTKLLQNLFLVAGDTGAGKSTIFDAIVFALYGEASSGTNKKSGAELQSQYVDSKLEPFVELTFTERNGSVEEEYTVRRVPRHIRAGRRTEVPARVSLRMPDGTEYAEKDIADKLVDLVGLTKSQFMQVAMIAQGEFMEMLRATSKDKREIFRKLFNTGLYDKIVKELTNRLSLKGAEIAQIRTAYRTEASHIRLPEGREDTAELATVLALVLADKNFSVTDMEQLMQSLLDFCKVLSEEQAQAQIRYQAACKLRDEKMTAVAEAKNLLENYAQLEQATKDWADCEAAKDEMKKNAALMSVINAAYEVLPFYHRVEDAARTVRDTKSNLQDLHRALPDLEAHYRQTAAQEAKAKAEQENALTVFTQTTERANKALEIFKRLKAARERVTNLQMAEEKAKDAADSAAEMLRGFEEQMQTWRKCADDLADADKLLVQWTVRCNEVADLAAELEKANLNSRSIALQKQHTEAEQNAYGTAREEYERENRAFEATQTAFLDAQAGFIAKEKLHYGQPCPVCGSLEHPNPCTLTAVHEELTRDAVEQMRRHVNALHDTMSEKAEAAGSAAKLLVAQQTQASEAWTELKRHFDSKMPDCAVPFNAETAAEALDRCKKDLVATGAQYKANANALAEAKEKLQGADEKKAALSNAAKKTAEYYMETRTALSAGWATLEGLETSQDFPNENAAVAAITLAKKAKAEKDALYNAAHLAADDAKTRKENCDALTEKYTKDLPLQEAEYARRWDDFNKALSEHKMTQDEWTDTLNMHDRDEIAELQHTLSAYSEKKAIAETMQRSARKAIGEKKKPVPEEIEAESMAANAAYNEAHTALERANEYLSVNRNVLALLEPCMEDRKRALDEYRRLDTLQSLLGGKASGGRMDIETFVQRHYLEKILNSANDRFQEMSAGQYEFRMYDIDKAGEGKNRGLDLMVYSTVTGKEREVRTLSGGESFMAALALALGMADQIQQNSAAINLDIMFIDEGFGSLDNHSRGQAIKVLQQMAGGSKLVGIISHVSELKQQIEDQLIVTKDDNGSHVKWQFG